MGKLLIFNGEPIIPIEWDKVALFTDTPEGPYDGRVKVKWHGKIRRKVRDQQTGKTKTVTVTVDPATYTLQPDESKVHEVDLNGSVRFGRRPFHDENLMREIRYSVWHHSVTFSAQSTEEILRERNLSVHFGLDPDGTLYQFLDLAWRDRSSENANDRGIGIETTNVVDVHQPPPKGYEGRPIVKGMSQGVMRTVWDYTPEQKQVAMLLCQALCSYFPRMAPHTPEGLDKKSAGKCLRGNVYGILGHAHITGGAKWDPNPAFDFKLCEKGARIAVARNMLLAASKMMDPNHDEHDQCWQRTLQCFGYELPSFGADGDWGEESLKALNIFRTTNNLLTTSLTPTSKDLEVVSKKLAEVTQLT